ncbi:ABC transporter ATP-binding/permease protein [Burkholderiales bacterium]|nr:ABC transporter ATP-binding/permease protein [Burkholderiales bacterium]
MAKIVLHLEDGSTREYALTKDRLTIGRRAANDIIVTNLAVSAEHAAILTIPPDSFVEDLDSTNGTYVNGRQIKRHFLRDGDIIEIGRHRLVYQTADGPPQSVATTVTVDGSESSVGKISGEPAAPPAPTAVLRIASGPNAGKQVALERETTALGKVGKAVITITRRPHGYFLAQLEGTDPPMVNGKAMQGSPYPLFANDVIELGGVKMELQVSGAGAAN